MGQATEMDKTKPLSTRALGISIRGRPAGGPIPVRPQLRQLEYRYAANLRALLTPYREMVEAKLFPVLEFITEPTKPRQDDAMDLLEHIFSGLRIVVARIFDDPQVTKVATSAAEAIDTKNRDLFRKQVKTVLGVDPLIYEPWLLDEVKSFVKENASLIKTIPTENLPDIQQMVYREARRGLSPREIRVKIMEQFDLAEYRAELIARDQVSKFNGRLSKLRQTGLGVERYIWRTSEDERVRDDHRALDGTEQLWSKPPVTVTTGKRAGERNHPGDDIQCRCYAEPILTDLLR